MDIITYSLCNKKAKQYTDDAIEGLGKGIIYKGAVNYYNDLPNNASIGDCYSILYKGTSGTESSGLEYVWGKINGQSPASWIQLGADISDFEDSNNKVIAINENSTDTQYPSAKCVYDLVGNIEELLNNLDTGNGVE